MHEIYDTYRDSGISAAWERFSSFTGVNIRGQDDRLGTRRRRLRKWRTTTAPRCG